MIKFGILSIGEGGSNIGEYASKKGFQVMSVNTATIDFEKLTSIKRELRLHLKGWEGAGRNRNVGKEAMLAHADMIFEKAKIVFNDCDMVFVSATTSGGTGSGGIAVGIEILSEINNRIGVITTLPESNEGSKAHMNSLECFSEISQIEYLGSVFSIDNEKSKSIFDTKDRLNILHLSNQQIINNILEVANLCSKNSYLSNFDKNDFLSILEERGSTIITKIKIMASEIKNNEDVIDAFHESIKNSCSPNIHSTSIVKAAILGIVPRHYMSFLSAKDVFSSIGTCYDIFESYYPIDDNECYCTFYFIMSGLSFPFERLKEIESGVLNVEKDIINAIEYSKSQKFETSNWSSKFEKKETIKRTSLSEKLSKYK